MEKQSIVLGICASSCNFAKMEPVLRNLVAKYNVIPVISSNADLPNRFVSMAEFRKQIIDITGNPIITDIAGAEKLSSTPGIVATVIMPATGNTIAKLAHAITDTSVTMAAKALLRNGIPCIIGLSTNDALSGNAANIGTLLNRRNYYFVPFNMDDHEKKPYSMACNFHLVIETIEYALNGKQIQPIIARKIV
ncbi:MAG: dipicolinate synthase subunit B [Firmicutes bacterium]|nr:dipicolinate synthase subunit B [Bacillota bacterium]